MSGISFGPTDLSLSKGFSKNLSFEDFQNFQEIGAYCGLDLMILVTLYISGLELARVPRVPGTHGIF